MAQTIIEPWQAVTGQLVTHRGQVYEVVAVKPWKRRDGTPTKVLVWRTRCPDCGGVVEFSTGLMVWSWRRRCDACKKPGKPVTRRKCAISRMDDDALRAVWESGPAEQRADAFLEMQRRRRREVRRLRHVMETGTAAERHAAQRALKKLRAGPTEGVRRQRRKAPSIFD